MIHFFTLILLALTVTNLSYSAESKAAAAHGIMPALEKTREPEIRDIPQILVSNNSGSDASLTLSYSWETKNRTRVVESFVDANQTQPIPVYMGNYILTTVHARDMYRGKARFEPLELTDVQKAFLSHNDAYISLEDIDGRLQIYVRRYRGKSVEQEAIKPSAKTPRQAIVGIKREVSVVAPASFQ